ncbi:hypothetical protein [Aliiroseovarius crassostreae]|uniref:hypothetical protein n=1 Tax=Aliiroseovarius crassostreae TaxID=154981 RepID=UPI003C7C4F44
MRFGVHNNTLRESTIGGVVRAFFDRFLDDEGANRFTLSAQLDVVQLERAFREGIEEIDLGLGGFRSALEEVFEPNAGVPQTSLGRLANWFREDRDADYDDAAASVQTRISMRPGRDWKKENVKELMADLAQDVYREEDDDGFVIVTKSGLRLSKGNLTIHKPFSVQGNKQVVTPKEVLLRMDAIMEGLQENRVIDG